MTSACGATTNPLTERSGQRLANVMTVAEHGELDLTLTADTSRKRRASDGGLTPSQRTTGKARRVKTGGKSQDCSICVETKPRHDFPRITGCDHGPEVCRDCLQTNFIIKIQANPDAEWRGCLCPLCDRIVPRSQVRRALGADSEVSDLIEKVSSGFLLSTGTLYADTDTAEAAEASQLQMVCRCALQL